MLVVIVWRFVTGVFRVFGGGFGFRANCLVIACWDVGLC